jgi:hypothetical protein
MKFPLLHRVAMEVLIIPATSASSERVFSVAGYILNKKRTRLTGNRVNILIFLKYQLEKKTVEKKTVIKKPAKKSIFLQVLNQVVSILLL